MLIENIEIRNLFGKFYVHQNLFATYCGMYVSSLYALHFPCSFCKRESTYKCWLHSKCSKCFDPFRGRTISLLCKPDNISTAFMFFKITTK